MGETKLREDICRFGRSLFERGLTPGSSGNISVKLDDEDRKKIAALPKGRRFVSPAFPPAWG